MNLLSVPWEFSQHTGNNLQLNYKQTKAFLCYLYIKIFEIRSSGMVVYLQNNSSVWLESNGPGTEKFEGELYIPREELSFSEVVVEVSCQKLSVVRFWQAVTKTEEKESSLEEWKVSLRIWTVSGSLLFSHADTFFLIVEIVPTIDLILEEFCAILGIALTCEAQPSHV